jgi:hypothetical protein
MWMCLVHRRGKTLHVKYVTSGDTGVYWCQASNVLGSVTGAVATVHVTTGETTAANDDTEKRFSLRVYVLL